MITAVAIVGYFLAGMGIARLIFSLSVRTGYYESRFNQDEIHVLMGMSVLFWPVTLVATSIWGLCKGVSKTLTVKPPESNSDRKDRKRREKQELERSVHRLETELGIHVADGCPLCKRVGKEYQEWRSLM